MRSNNSKADFSNAELSQVVFGRDNIHNKTAIMGANFPGVDLTGAVFQGVIYDDLTPTPSRMVSTQQLMTASGEGVPLRQEQFPP